MTWQSEQVAASDTYLGFLTSMVAVATSHHVSAVAVNAGGSGHVVGDRITITHASAHHDLVLEVTSVSSGAITGVIIVNGGAFAERLASATVNAGGTGYAVGDILEVQDGAGASYEKAKVYVDTVSSGAVTGVSVFETGGAYSTTPTTTAAATIGRGPSTYAGGDDCTLDLTMQSIIGTSGIAQSSTDGAGTGATFDLTLTHSGWSAVLNRNSNLIDSADYQKEVVLLGTVSTGDAPYIGFFTYRQDSAGQKRYGVACFGMTAFNAGLAMASQPNIGPIAWTLGANEGSNILVAEEVAENNLWGISVTPRRICGFIRGNIAGEADSYHTFYVGFGNGFGPATTTPYPMIVAASSNVANRRTSDSESTGLSEAFQSPNGTGPIYYLRKSDLAWTTVRNAITPTNREESDVMWPRGVTLEPAAPHRIVDDDNYLMLGDGFLGSHFRANVTGRIYPTPGATPIYPLLPLTIVSSGGLTTPNVNATIVAELDGCFFIGGVDDTGTVFTPEDEIEQGGVRYVLVPNSTDSLANRPYQFIAFRKD